MLKRIQAMIHLYHLLCLIFLQLYQVTAQGLNLRGINLRLAAYHAPPHSVLLQSRDGNYSASGVGVDIFIWLSKRLNFTTTVVPIVDDEITKQIGIYEATFSKIISKEIDGAFSGVAMSPDRAKRLDYTSGITWAEPYNIVSSKLGFESRIFAFVRPFKPTVWLLLGLSILMFIMMTTFFTNYFERFNRDYLIPKSSTTDSQEGSSRSLQIRKSWLMSSKISYYSVYTVCILTNHGAYTRYYYHSFRILVGCWLLAAFVLVNSYSSIVVSSLTIPTLKPVVNSLEDLLTNNEVTMLVAKTVVIGQIILDAKSGTLFKLGRELRKHPADRIFIDFQSLYKKMEGGHYALPWLTSSNRDFVAKQFRKERTCRFHLSDPLPFVGFFSLSIFQKNFKYTSVISDKYIELWETGFIRYWIEHLSPRADQCFDRSPPKITNAVPIKLEDLTSAFLILGLGIGLASIIFFIELFLNYFNMRKFHA